jgi:hypothetical protein
MPLKRSLLSLCLFAFFISFPFLTQAQNSPLKITALDEVGAPIAAVKIELKKTGTLIGTVLTDDKGQAMFPNLGAGTYEISATKEGLEPRVKSDLVITAGVPNELELVMVPKVNITDTVNVTATTAATNPVEQGASVSTDLGRQQAKDTALRPHTVADALLRCRWCRA